MLLEQALLAERMLTALVSTAQLLAQQVERIHTALNQRPMVIMARLLAQRVELTHIALQQCRTASTVQLLIQ